MSHEFSHIQLDILQFLARVLPDLPTPVLGFLGGSRASSGQHLAMKNSDHDVLLFFPHLPEPVSYTFRSDNRKRKYDLILRDSMTFAHDIEQEVVITGRGTLLQLASHSLPIFGTPQSYTPFQKGTLDLHTFGPDILAPQDKEDMLARHEQSIRRHQVQSPSQEKHTVFSLALLNRLAGDLLRCSPRWSAQGKIAYRFLGEELQQAPYALKSILPDTRIRLITAFHSASTHGRYDDFIFLITHRAETLYTLSKSQDKDTSPRRQRLVPYDLFDDFAAAITNSRICPDSFSYYRRQDSQLESSFAASTWAHIKIGVVTDAISRERHLSRPDEYLFALARGASAFTEMCAAIHSSHPNALRLDERVSLAFEHYPEVGQKIQLAINGQPKQFVELFRSLLSHFQHEPAKFFYRPSPAHFRKPLPATLDQALNLSIAARHPA